MLPDENNPSICRVAKEGALDWIALDALTVIHSHRLRHGKDSKPTLTQVATEPIKGGGLAAAWPARKHDQKHVI